MHSVPTTALSFNAERGKLKDLLLINQKKNSCGIKLKRKDAIWSPKVDKKMKLHFHIQISESGTKSIISVSFVLILASQKVTFRDLTLKIGFF